jgi:hypothetical protein
MAYDIHDHLILLPQRHDVLAEPKASITLGAEEQIQIDGWIRHTARFILCEPTLAYEIQHYEAVLVYVVEQIPQSAPDRNGDVIDAVDGAHMGGHAECERLQNACLVNLPFEALVAMQLLHRELRLRRCRPKILSTEEGGVVC